VSATNVQVTNDSAAGQGVTQLTATTPAVSSVGNWYVQVSTAGGTSTGTGFIFTYGAQQPLVIGISPSSGGPSSNVSQITITGSNFLVGSTSVSFYLDTSGAPAGSAIASSVVVTSSTALTATLPTTKLTKGSSYFPEVTTSISGTDYTSQTYNESADIFTYTG
jgi:IPT/TIG domain